MKYNVITYSDKGPRAENQDRLNTELVLGQFMTASIADGVGGNNFGAIAAEKAIEYFHTELHQSEDRTMSKIFLQVHKKIRTFIDDNSEFEGMLTTLTGCVISDKNVWFGHIGDTRLYILNKEKIVCLTQDHTTVGELIRSGALSIEDLEFYPQKNVLTNALGTRETPIIQTGIHNLKKGEIILLTTDGIHDSIKDSSILHQFIRSNDLAEFSAFLQMNVDLSLANDNYSFICIEPIF